MSGSGRKRSSKWDFKAASQNPIGDARGNDCPGKSGTYFHDKEPESDQLHSEANARNGTRRSRSRSMSRSRSRSRSGSPFHGVRRESRLYDRCKDRPRFSPQTGRDIDGKYRRVSEHQSVQCGDQGDEHGWEAKNRKERDSRYCPADDSREQSTRGRRSATDTGFPEDKSRREIFGRRLHDGTSDGSVRRHRNESIRERDSHRRDGNAVLVNNCEGELRRNSDIPCKFFDAGNCRNGNYCRFSHQSVLWGSPDGKPHHDGFRHDNNPSERRKWNLETSDTRKSSGIETTSVNAGTSEPKVNGSWLDDMEMSPDWNYGNNTTREGIDLVSKSCQTLGLKDSLAPAHEHGDLKGWAHGSAGISQNLVSKNCYLEQDQNNRGTNVYSHSGNIMAEKPLSSNHDPNSPANIAPVKAFKQKGQSQGSLPYKSSVHVRGSQVLNATDLSEGLGLSNSGNAKVLQDNHSGKSVFGDLEPPKVNCENAVTREQLNQISNISASLVQLFGNGQQLPQLYSTLNPQNAMQGHLHTNFEGYAKPESSVVIQPNQAAVSKTCSDLTSNCIAPKGIEMGAVSEGVPAFTAAQTKMTDAQQRRLPDKSVSSALPGTTSEPGPADRSHKPDGKPKASEENSDKRFDESKKEQDERGTTGMGEDAENAEDDDKADESKKGKDPKGMRAFKFALVEIVKELLKPAWKEGRMGRDAYKNIVKKVVDKVTGTIQAGNIPQSQEKVDHYLSSSKQKLTKLVQAYVDKYQKT